MAKSSKAGKKTSKRKTKKKKEEMLGGIAMTQSQALTLAMVIHNACRHLDPPEEVIEAIGPIVNQIGRVFDIEYCEECDMPCMPGTQCESSDACYDEEECFDCTC